MSTTLDPYEVLGVSKESPEDAIKKAFRQKARTYHPDNKETGNEERFKQVNQAYEILSDPQKKAIYDQYGMGGFQGGAGGAQGFDFAFNDISDLFSEFFGTGRPRRSTGPERGSDVRYNLEVDFLEAVKGVTKKISLSTLEDCKTCKGSGAKEGSSPVTCSTCQGAGEVKKVTESLFGHVTQIATCSACDGSGKTIKDPCESCHGNGRVRVKKDVDVKVPCGIDEGARLRWAGKGEAGKRGGPAGDLYVVIYIKEHEVFSRDGQNILFKKNISITDAVLGNKIEVPTVDGEKTLEIPPGTQSYSVLKILGLGVPKLNNASRRGDQLVQVIIETPTKLSKEEKKLYEEIAKLEGKNTDKKKWF